MQRLVQEGEGMTDEAIHLVEDRCERNKQLMMKTIKRF